jgi:radical SAM superfamily enzyme YgiQ (UPF0313 family)
MRRLAESLKKEFSIPIIWGGVHVSIAPHELPHFAEVGVLGEGEETVLELLGRFDGYGFRDPHSIKGIVFRDAGTLVKTEKRPVIGDLDTIPFPDIELLRVDWKRQQRAVIITSRGCPYKCRFCASSVFWDRTRLHTARYVFSEIRMLVSQYSVKEILIYDDFFTIDKNRVAELAWLISGDPELRTVRFECLSRLDTFDDTIAYNMKKMGIYKVSFGFESGCQKTLNYLKNGKLTLEQAEKAVGIAKKHGLQCVGSFVIGSPEETEAEIFETFRFIERLELDNIQITVATPFPGTELWEDGKRCGAIPDDEWRDDYYVMFAFAELDNDGVTVRDFLKNKRLLTGIDKERFIGIVEQAREVQMKINNRPACYARTLPDQINLCLHLAMDLQKQGKLNEAVSIVSVLYALKSDSLDLLNLLGELRHMIGDRQAAKEAFHEIIRRKPDYINAHNNLAILYFNEGDAAHSLEYLASALQINPDNRRTIIDGGEILKSLHQWDNARAVYSSYVARHPDDQEIQGLLTVISRQYQ